MDDLRLILDRAAWNSYTGEQRFIIGYLNAIVNALARGQPDEVAEVEAWLGWVDEVHSPAFCEQALDLPDGVVYAGVARRLAEAKERLANGPNSAG